MSDRRTLANQSVNASAASRPSAISTRITVIRNHLNAAGFKFNPESPNWSQFSQWNDAPSKPWGQWGDFKDK